MRCVYDIEREIESDRSSQSGKLSVGLVYDVTGQRFRVVDLVLKVCVHRCCDPQIINNPKSLNCRSRCSDCSLLARSMDSIVWSLLSCVQAPQAEL